MSAVEVLLCCRDQVLSVRLRAEDNDVQQAIRLLAPIVGQVSDGRERK